MSYEHILVDAEEGVGIVTLNRSRHAQRHEPAAVERIA